MTSAALEAPPGPDFRSSRTPVLQKGAAHSHFLGLNYIDAPPDAPPALSARPQPSQNGGHPPFYPRPNAFYVGVGYTGTP